MENGLEQMMPITYSLNAHLSGTQIHNRQVEARTVAAPQNSKDISPNGFISKSPALMRKQKVAFS